MAWEKLRHKTVGALGIGSVRTKNTAMLLKWWWRFGTDRTSLWRRVICGKYNCWYPSNWSRFKPSGIWKDIVVVAYVNPNILNYSKELSIKSGRWQFN